MKNYKRIIVETTEEEPVTIADITENYTYINSGFNVRVEEENGGAAKERSKVGIRSAEVTISGSFYRMAVGRGLKGVIEDILGELKNCSDVRVKINIQA